LGRVVLDTSVIVKAALKPGKWLPRSVYERELETHRKSRLLIRLLNEKGVELLVPFAALVEVAGVLARLASRDLAVKVVESLRTTRSYRVVYEYEKERDDEIRDYVIETALSTGSSGFDTYFIATAKLYNAALITDDEPMSIQAERVGVNTILVRKTSTEELIAKINELVGMTR